jgi:hypothetical protein
MNCVYSSEPPPKAAGPIGCAIFVLAGIANGFALGGAIERKFLIYALN